MCNTAHSAVCLGVQLLYARRQQQPTCTALLTHQTPDLQPGYWCCAEVTDATLTFIIVTALIMAM